MSALLTPSRPSDVLAWLLAQQKVWTRAECDALEAEGLLEGLRLELVEGELISRLGQNRPHINARLAIVVWLLRVFGTSFVNFEAPIDVAPGDNPINEPVPDAIVLNRESHLIISGNVGPGDIRLAVEVSDSSLQRDLVVKAGVYARAGIPEYWVLDVEERRLLVHRDPQAGRYRSVVTYTGDEAVCPLAAPDAEFHVSYIYSDPA